MKNPIVLPSFLLDDIMAARDSLKSFNQSNPSGSSDTWLDLTKVPLKLDDETIGYLVWFEDLKSYEFVMEQRDLKGWGTYVRDTEEFEFRVDNGKRGSVN